MTNVRPSIPSRSRRRPEEVPILQKTFRGFRIFGSVNFKKRVEGFLNLFSPFRHPDLVEALLGLLLKRVRKVVEKFGRLVNPAQLMLSGWSFCTFHDAVCIGYPCSMSNDSGYIGKNRIGK